MNKIEKIIHKKILNSLTELSFPIKEFSLTPSKNKKYGDLSTNVSLIIAKDLNKNPMSVSQDIINNLSKKLPVIINHTSITKPGFINFKIKDEYFQDQIKTILIENENYGKGNSGIGKTANVEFVSANPTGPLTIGHGRNAILGDTVANILEWQGYKITREYYFNDAGRQMRKLGQSVKARYDELLGNEFSFPEDGYQGEYIKNIAKDITLKKNKKDDLNLSDFTKYAEEYIFKGIKKSLKRLGIIFNTFTNEKTFYENGDIETLLKELKKKNLIYEKDNATWFRATKLGFKQDRVYIKSSGEPTYRVPDTAYHKNKIERNYDLIVDIFGADHADTYPDVLLALDALSYNTEHIKVLLYQFVTLIRKGEKVKMSTRKANFITLDSLVNEVGLDVVRYFFIMRSMNAHLDFDLDLATDQSEKNPVFYLQYAFARICNIIKRGEEFNITFDEDFKPHILSNDHELNLLKYLTRFPDYVNLSYKNFEPQNIATYLQELATRFHKFYSNCRVLSDDIVKSKSRIALIKAVKVVIKNGLTILGISAPEKM